MTRALGIDIGSSHIKIVEIEVGSRNRELIGLYEIPREEGLDPGAQLRDFLLNSGLTADRYIFGVGPAPVYLRRVTFPFGDNKRVNSAIQAEIEDSVPFPLENYLIDFKLTTKFGRVHNYLVGLCPQVWIDRLNTISESAKVVPWAFHLDAEALGQLALHQQLPAAHEGSLYAVVDLGHESTKVAIVRGFMPDPQDRKAKPPAQPGEVAEFRSINKGSSELINWIKNERKVSVEEAVQWLVHRAVIKTDTTSENDAKASITDNLSDELKVALRPIVVELYQTFQSYRGRGGDVPQAIYLTGALSDIKGLKEFLSEELRTPVYAWPIFLGFNSDKVPLTAEKERSFAVAMALAYRMVVRKPKGWLNFRRSPQAARKVLTKAFERLMTPQYQGLMLGLVVALFSVYIYSIVNRSFLATQEEAARTALVSELRLLGGAASSVRASNPDFLLRARAAYESEKKRKEQAELPKGRDPVERPRGEILMDFSSSLPPDALIQNIVVERAGAVIRINGVVTAKSAVTPETVASLRKVFEGSLAQRGYVEARLSGGSGNNLEFSAQWKGRPQ